LLSLHDALPIYAGADRHVEHRHRFVRDDHLWVEDERPRNRDALTLTARHLVREAVEEVLPGTEPGVLEGVNHEFGPLLASVRDAMDQERLRDGPQDGEPRVERLVRILEDHLEVPPEVEHLPRGQRGDVRPLEQDESFRGGLEARDEPSGRRLATAALPHQAEDLSLHEVEADPVHGVHVHLLAPERAEKPFLQLEVPFEFLDAHDRPGRRWDWAERDAARKLRRGSRRQVRVNPPWT